MESNRPAPSPPARRGRRKLGRPRLLIIGCGDIGLRIVSRLAARFRLIALTSTPARAARLRAAGIVPIVGDLDHRQSLGRLRGLAPRLVHLAPPPNEGDRDTRTRNLIAAQAGVIERSVYISTSGVYGDYGGQRIDETARLRPANDRAVRRVDAERVMRGRLHAVILRVPGIYAHDRLPLDRLRQNLPALAEADDVYTNHIHAEDLARIAIAALVRGRAARVYNTVDNSALRMAEYFDLVADAMGLPHPPRLARAELKAAVSPMMYSFMTESRRISNRRMRDELQVRLLYPTVASALATLRTPKTDGPAGPSA
ncbi:MAG: SDR family NAD(P)-dependent oxidoreductase [Betaproteobacteria bacterium]